MKIAFFEIKDWTRAYLEKNLPAMDAVFFDEPLTEASAEKASDAEVVSVFVHSKVTRAAIEKMPRLKLIATQSTGFDHIDLEVCREKNIAVSNVPHYGENTVAEHTFALILALSRNVHKSYVRTTQGDFSIEGLKGFDLKDKTLGVIGTGRIGLHVIRIAKGFGMHVLAYDVRQDNFLAEVLHFQYAPFEEVLGKSDIISLHTPYSESTHHLINENSIEKIKHGALLINTARGGLIDNKALIKALDRKILAGAALDVLEGEELIMDEKQLLYDNQANEKLQELAKNHILLSRDNVVFTPHIAFYSQEALERILRTTVENIESFAAGRPINSVT